MGLMHPHDLDAWHGWQRSRQRIRRLRRSLRHSEPDSFILTTFGDEPRILVAIDSNSPTSHASLLEPLRHLEMPVAVLSPDGPVDVPGHNATGSGPVRHRELPPSLRGVRGVVSLGQYMPRGGLAHAWAERLGAHQFVTQHGALTPFAPPLPSTARLLAWSRADAEFWKSGRVDVEYEVVGSHLLWTAGQHFRNDLRPSSTTQTDRPLMYLGQLHAAELSRSRLVLAAASFCKEHSATYRPHPSERDKLSRLAHEGYRRLGITVEGSTPLAELDLPVVSVFSTGVLEAATQGRDAWVDFPRPPAWLGEFWERYGMHRIGDTPTPPPEQPTEEPARRIAELLVQATG